MKLYIGIDDTDSIEQGATGESAKQMMKMIENNWGECRGLTRHQLFLHPDIAYTSHNSSMCFIADVEAIYIKELIKEAGRFLETYSAPGSDPGLCVAVEEYLCDNSRLIAFGYDTKKKIMDKCAAYNLAGKLDIHLSEHGGTGDGIIGALAAVGLRMTDNDGRFQGRLNLKYPGAIMTVEEIISNSPTETVCSIDSYQLKSDEKVVLGNKLKTVLLDGKCTLLVYRREGSSIWETCTNVHIEAY